MRGYKAVSNVYPDSLRFRFRFEPLFEISYTAHNRIHGVLDWALAFVRHSELNSQCSMAKNFHFFSACVCILQ